MDKQEGAGSYCRRSIGPKECEKEVPVLALSMAVTAFGIAVVPTNDALAETPLVDKVEHAIRRTKLG